MKFVSESQAAVQKYREETTKLRVPTLFMSHREIISISVLGPSSVSSGIIKVDQIQSNQLWRTQTKHKLVSVRND